MEPRAGVEEAQCSVAEVVGAVRGTVARVLERDGRLAELDQRACRRAAPASRPRSRHVILGFLNSVLTTHQSL